MIRMEKITRRYGENLVLDKFDLEVAEREAVAVVGESGCGKTTLLRILAGLDREYEGHVFLAGQPADGKPSRERGLAMVFQEAALWNHMTVEENILFSLGRHTMGIYPRGKHPKEENSKGRHFQRGNPRGVFPSGRQGQKEAEDRVGHICQALEIEGLRKRYPAQISGGQAKRVSLARALASDKEILLLDEPLSNIDSRTREKILEFLRKEYAGKRTLLYVSHSMEEVEYLCSRVVAL